MTTECALILNEYLVSVMSPMFEPSTLFQNRFRWTLYGEDSQALLTSYIFHLECNLVSGCSDDRANLRSLLVARLSVLLMQISTRLWTREKTNSAHPLCPIFTINPDYVIFH